MISAWKLTKTLFNNEIKRINETRNPVHGLKVFECHRLIWVKNEVVYLKKIPWTWIIMLSISIYLILSIYLYLFLGEHSQNIVQMNVS